MSTEQRWRIMPTVALLAGVSTCPVVPAAADPGTTERVNVSSAGKQGIGFSRWPSLSADGRFVAFHSDASNLVRGDTNESSDVFVRDRQTGTTERVSVDSAGTQGNNGSGLPSLSADGRFVAFVSRATNLVPNITNDTDHIFVHDRQTGTTERVSVSSAGEQGNDVSVQASISADGRFVGFTSRASNLVPGDTNGKYGAFVHDRQTSITEQVSVDSAGTPANNDSFLSSLSADGRFVAFVSPATNLAPGDTNGTFDVFVHDRQTRVTERVSVNSAGTQGNGDGVFGALSADGRFVAFSSAATNWCPCSRDDKPDVFVRDRQTGTTERVSVSSAGEPGNDSSGSLGGVAISAGGRFVAFDSFASNLVPGDTNGTWDVFVHDRKTGITERVSISSTGIQGNGESFNPSISADGRFVGFESGAFNLVPGDTNQNRDVFVHDRGNSTAAEEVAVDDDD